MWLILLDISHSFIAVSMWDLQYVDLSEEYFLVEVVSGKSYKSVLQVSSDRSVFTRSVFSQWCRCYSDWQVYIHEVEQYKIFFKVLVLGR